MFHSTQYPVFPWVLADYTSSHLDLDDPTNESGVFRDLTKPIGALNPQRLKMFLDRYHSLDDPEMPAFMYGTHYSSSGTVLFYLLRMEPFTTAAIELQGGKFEHADRMFSSIAACWAGVTSNAADVKELTPEFFYFRQSHSDRTRPKHRSGCGWGFIAHLIVCCLLRVVCVFCS